MSERCNMMTDEEYSVMQSQILLLAGLVGDMNLPAFLERISIAHATGPILDPTLYRAAIDNLQTIEQLARQLLPFHREAVKVREAALAEARK